MTINAQGHDRQENADERRSSERKLLVVEVRFDGAASGAAKTREIGLGGLYLETTANLPVNSQLKLNFRLGETDINVNAIVVYSDAGQGVGVRFLNVSETVETVLKRELPAIETANVSVSRR